MYWTDDLPDQTIGQALAGAAARFGDREAFTYADRRLSFHDAVVEADRVARALLASGVRRGDHIAVMMASHAPWTALYFGVLKIGAVLVPVSTRFRPDEIEFSLVKSHATMLFFLREVKGRTDYGNLLLEVFPELREARPGALRARRAPLVRTIVDLAEKPMTGTLGFDEFLDRGKNVTAGELEAAARAVDPRDEAIVMYTSGTTAFPKGALLSHAGMMRGGSLVAGWLLMGEKDVYFTVQPFYHSGGAIGAILPPIVSGCRMVTQPYFDAGDALDAMEREHATILVGHQPHFIEYLNHPTLAQRRLVLERMLPIAPPEIYWMIYEKLGIEGLVSGYGMTETHMYGTGTSLVHDPMEVRFNTNGRPTPNTEVQIRDPDDGTLLGPEESGEIFLRTPYPMLGYLEDPEATAAVLQDGWYRTGDRGVIRKDGNLCLLGRVREMIRVGGENLAAAEVEACLLEHSAVKQAAAVAAPDQRLGEVVVAFIELKPSAAATDAELIAHCRSKLAAFKVPRAVHFVTSWPMAGSGKVQKRLLLETVS